MGQLSTEAWGSLLVFQLNLFVPVGPYFRTHGYKQPDISFRREVPAPWPGMSLYGHTLATPVELKSGLGFLPPETPKGPYY